MVSHLFEYVMVDDVILTIQLLVLVETTLRSKQKQTPFLDCENLPYDHLKSMLNFSRANLQNFFPFLLAKLFADKFLH